MGLDSVIDRIAEFQLRHAALVAVFSMLLTGFFLVGILNIRLETDFTKELPQDNPYILLQNNVRDTFGGTDSVLVLVQLDPSSTSKNAVKDIRDPRVMRMLLDLEGELRDESGVDGAQSIATVFGKIGVPGSLEGVKAALSRVPMSSQSFNKDYSATMLYVFASLGSSNEKTKALTDAVERDIGDVSAPPGIKVSITGMPPIRTTLMDILVSDAKYTMALASAIILLLLVVTNKPLSRGFLVFLPLLLALIWTLGTMGWLDIPLSIVTVGVGAMILGLGVEYSVFYESVYRKKIGEGGSQLEAIKTSLKEVGTAIFGSASTTVVGFLALLLASMPLMHHLGFTLALGITYCFIAALAVNPSFIVLEENIVHKILPKWTSITVGEEVRR